MSSRASLEVHGTPPLPCCWWDIHLFEMDTAQQVQGVRLSGAGQGLQEITAPVPFVSKATRKSCTSTTSRQDPEARAHRSWLCRTGPGSPGEQGTERTQTITTCLDTRELLQLLQDGFGVPDEDGGHAHLPGRLQVLPDVIQEDDLEIQQREPGSAPRGRAAAGFGHGLWVLGGTLRALFLGWRPYLLRLRPQRIQGVGVDLGIGLPCSEPAGLDHQVEVAAQEVHQRGREEPPGAVVHPVVGEDAGLKS